MIVLYIVILIYFNFNITSIVIYVKHRKKKEYLELRGLVKEDLDYYLAIRFEAFLTSNMLTHVKKWLHLKNIVVNRMMEVSHDVQAEPAF